MKYTATPVIARRQRPLLCSRREQGVVLLIALIVLVAMTLAGVGLIRSTYTTNMIAGNLAFNQAATEAGDIGTERALTFLQSRAGSLNVNNQEAGYAAMVFDPEPGVSWEAFWRQLVAGQNSQGALIFPKPFEVTGGDTGAYRVSYVIHRLCDGVGSPNEDNACVKPPRIKMDGSPNIVSGGDTVVSQVYYRITVRVAGPRNTQSFIQTVVAI